MKGAVARFRPHHGLWVKSKTQYSFSSLNRRFLQLLKRFFYSRSEDEATQNVAAWETTSVSGPSGVLRFMFRLSPVVLLLGCRSMLRFIALALLFAWPALGAERFFDFSEFKPNETPSGFRSAVT